MHTKIEEILKLAVASKASDVHLFDGAVPEVRVGGELSKISTFEAVDEDMILSILNSVQAKEFAEGLELDFSLTVGSSRFRVNIYRQRAKVAVAFRVVLAKVPTVDQLGLPGILHSFTKMKHGFVLVTGPTGHGKSTTVASVLDEINKSQNTHIVTIEDPIEYVIEPAKSIVSQREVGGDTLGFAQALRSCLRQDPNVVFVGEMRDLETISAALTVAETGHLVFSTLHTNSAAQTISRIIDVFPEETKDQIRVQLSEVITAVVAQRLIPAINGGRVVATEILMAVPSVKNIIREGKTFMIDNVIQTGTDMGMMSLDMSLARLVKSGVVAEDVALNYSLKPAELQSNLRSLR